MTLFELWQLIRRYWFIVVGLPVLFIVALIVFASLTASSAGYTATSSINVNTQLPFVSGLVSNEVADVQEDNPEISVKTKSDTAQMTISVTVKGPSADSVMNAANEIAHSAVDKAQSIYSEIGVGDASVPFFAEAHDAADAAKDGNLNGKYILVAILAGLLLGICVLVFIDTIRRPIKGVRDVMDSTDLDCLAELRASEGGKRLLANLRLSSVTSGHDKQQWCFLPTGNAKDAMFTAEAVKAAAVSENISISVRPSEDGGPMEQADSQIEVVYCKSVAEDVSGVYSAQNSNLVALVIRLWADSHKELEVCVHELELAKANVAGFVLIK